MELEKITLEKITLDDITENNIDEIMKLLNKMTFSERCKIILRLIDDADANIDLFSNNKPDSNLKKLGKIYEYEFKIIHYFNIMVERIYNKVDETIDDEKFILFACRIADERDLSITNEERENNENIIYPLFLEQNKQTI